MAEIDWENVLDQILDKRVIEQALANGPIPIFEGERELDGPALLTILANPVYAGLGPYPALIDDEIWIMAVQKQIERIGPPLVLRVLLDSLRQSLNQFFE